MATTTTQMGSFYSEKLATSELRKYRDKGPIPSTQALIEALNAEGVEGSTLLDVGGGIGAIQHELLAAGAASATSVDASAPYLAAAREELVAGQERVGQRRRVRLDPVGARRVLVDDETAADRVVDGALDRLAASERLEAHPVGVQRE